MWLRKIGVSSTASAIVLPAQMMRDLGWKRGDYLQIDVAGVDAIAMRRVAPEKLPDRIISAAMEPEKIQYE